ncbi:MAG: NAD(P)H-dependent oxidoreductase [Oscillospiraceae bacterium]|jgi:flavodoxin|nr:NAD(P)H-dependent oxidoreductase [Oscillospiraceae bacterium]MBQ1755770.1 NAD(P)H-dependent oxidoreductase [Oscillospiraceae bacterium]MBQ2144233.1 NAD(P)H-dependent oxidoreductase [Oscillospiraceae bacterium]MBQ2203214.1 NAD(P)H-dependent oxidoreductase [Oscillospiraceae bacterium]MBQ4302757.1 NAD(P)H-dependent oxidoreductase [Oscillospiraceae bacterium]
MRKTLVAYFSASGVTARLAQKLAAVTDADLFEIVPETPYTAADLDWTNKASRSSVEMNDPTSRPAVASRAADLSRYDRIFVGFPIWWYTAPTIVNTFLEQYDLTGKTVVPFATSGMSPIGRSAADLRPSAKGAQVLDGRRFSADVPDAELRQWAENQI